jgi:predicted nucleotidyltransferase/predicted transcriptional regulator
MRFHLSVADIISSPVRLKVAGFLLTHEAPMSEREIASVLKISHMSVNRAMGELSEINFVSYKTVGKAHMWMVNRKSYAYTAVSKIVESVNAEATPLVALKELVLKYLPKETLRVVLFGSVAKGEERDDSDIDLLIVVRTEKDKANLEPKLEKLSSACLDMFGNRLAPYIVSEKEWKAKKSLPVVKEAERGLVFYSVEKYKTFLTGRFSLNEIDVIGTVPASSKKETKESWPAENSFPTQQRRDDDRREEFSCESKV